MPVRAWRREGEAAEKWTRQTDCVARRHNEEEEGERRPRERERERDKRDADIKLVARQIKRKEKNWSREGQKKP